MRVPGDEARRRRIDLLAEYVAKDGGSVEAMILEKERDNPGRLCVSVYPYALCGFVWFSPPPHLPQTPTSSSCRTQTATTPCSTAGESSLW